MQNEMFHAERKTPESVPVPARQRLFDWAKRAWRPAGTVIAVALALLLMGHVING